MADRQGPPENPAGEDGRRLAFRAVRVDPTVLAYLGRLPKSIARCLKRAFAQIREKRLRMDPAWRHGQFLTFACSHLITVSVTRDRQTVVILSVVYDPEGEEP